MRTTALPSLMMLTMTFHSMRRAWGSIPVVGSSWWVERRLGSTGWELALPITASPWAGSPEEDELTDGAHSHSPHLSKTGVPSCRVQKAGGGSKNKEAWFFIPPFQPTRGLKWIKAMTEFSSKKENPANTFVGRQGDHSGHFPGSCYVLCPVPS